MHHACSSSPLRRILCTGLILIVVLLFGRPALAYDPPCPIPGSPGSTGCSGWALDSTTFPMSDLVPGCPAAPHCAVKIVYATRRCFNPAFVDSTCQVYIKEIIIPGCACDAGAIIQALTTRLLTSLNPCAGTGNCSMTTQMFMASCMKPLYDSQGNVYQLAACPEYSGCCGRSYGVCPDGNGGFTITLFGSSSIGSADCQIPNDLTSLDPFLGTCISLCEFTPEMSGDSGAPSISKQ